ncbi:CGL63 [Auxenochlorella protothecoides x Auxenochlorella symbiontica]|uniref:Uncharacterized protein n=1 Tax=Auxenochlorella protothecoides TaxID=3075 RepID=A0A1D1ZYZ6_AUXPR
MSTEEQPTTSSDKPGGLAHKLTSGLNEQVQDVTSSLSAILDQGLATASDVVRSSTAVATSEANKAASQAKDLYSQAELQYKQGEAAAFGYLKEGVRTVVDNKETSIAMAIGVAAIGLRGPRRFLWRHTLGRLRSEEAVFKSAELRSVVLAEKVEGQALELKKLQERLGLAQAEYTRGLSKLKATASELQSLSSRIGGTQQTASGLVQDLRSLPSKHALSLRSEVAQKLAVAETQRKAVDKLVLGLARQGI